MEHKELSSRGGRATRRPYHFNITDIANAVGKSVVATQKDHQRGKFNPDDLSSLTKYIHENTRV